MDASELDHIEKNSKRSLFIDAISLICMHINAAKIITSAIFAWYFYCELKTDSSILTAFFHRQQKARHFRNGLLKCIY
ncbi:MAG: hypothetical protein ACI9VT_004265, partial [Psychroserpens sp.]